MTKEQAIQLSIEKWEDIVNHEGVDDGGFNCALCHQYIHCGYAGFSKCPIYEITGKPDCDNTPYEKWTKHHSNEHPNLIFKPKKIRCNMCKRLAKKELEFLRSLLE